MDGFWPQFAGTAVPLVSAFAVAYFAWRLTRTEAADREQRELRGAARAIGHELSAALSSCRVQAYQFRDAYHRCKESGISVNEFLALFRPLPTSVYLANAMTVGRLPNHVLVHVYEAYDAIFSQVGAAIPLTQLAGQSGSLSAEQLKRWAEVFDDVSQSIAPALDSLTQYINDASAPHS